MACQPLQRGQSVWEHDVLGSSTAAGGNWQHTSTLRMQGCPLGLVSAGGAVCNWHSRFALRPR